MIALILPTFVRQYVVWRPSSIAVSVALVFCCSIGDTCADQRRVDFRKDVYPLLKERCFRCHAGQDAEAGYRLDVRAEILGETNGEPLVAVGNSKQSRLIQLVAGKDADVVMPPEGEGGPLSDEQVSLLRAWIDEGLSWDDELLPPPGRGSDHWAFLAVLRPALPKPNEYDVGWALTPVDAFVSAKHQQHDLQPSPPADHRTLIVRAALDLTGLPPTPEEVEAFVRDESPDAYERMIDRLLASPAYGERWGRHWLDVARWAESEGFESNHDRPFAWRYRDWVVRAFNEDKPYDEFVTQQLAGDELVPYADENLIATGFLAAARISSNEEDKALQRNDTLVDIVNATGSAFLGLTIGCAQCHNHKFDPLTQRDYYRLQAFFVRGMPNNFKLRDARLRQQFSANAPPEYESLVTLKEVLFERGRQAYIAKVKEDLAPETLAALAAPEPSRTPRQHELFRQADLLFQAGNGTYEGAIPEEDKKLYAEVKKKLAAIEKDAPAIPQTWAYFSPASSPHEIEALPQVGFYPLPYDPELLREKPAFLLVRGNVHQRGPALSPGWPEAFSTARARLLPSQSAAPAQQELRPPTGYSRLRLARWLTDRDNPLTARVWVNRIWQYHFGRGIVATAGDFGTHGERPTHPELLDWLAAELVDSGWSTKHVQRLILLSATYRHSGERTRRAGSINSLNPRGDRDGQGSANHDPENRYLWHFPFSRLEVEAIRDRILTVSGELDRAIGGERGEDGGRFRRTLYLQQKRDAYPEMQRLFDVPSASESCARRHVSTVSLQPLYLLNSEFTYERAKALAKRVCEQANEKDDIEQQIEVAFKHVLLRSPSDDERQAAADYFQTRRAADDADPLTSFCHALLNLNEFVYLE